MVLRVHDAIYQATDGRLGHRMVGVPTLLLRSTGRKSGEIRTNSLTYARAGEDYLLVASNGGSDKAPAWLHNIRANGQVEIQIGRKRMAATAREVKRGEPGFDEMWANVNEHNHDRYIAYQRKTTRQIPVVVVTSS